VISYADYDLSPPGIEGKKKGGTWEHPNSDAE
jgi:hypothetical protein